MKGAPMKKLTWRQVLKALYERFQKDEITALSAQMTYYLIVAFFPFLIFFITLITYTPLLTEEFLSPLAQIAPQETYELIIEVAGEMRRERSLTLLSTGMITALWAASNGMDAIMRGVNKAYNEVNTRSFIVHRLLALALTLGLILVLITNFLLLVLGRGLAAQLFHYLGVSTYFISVWNWVRYALSLLIMWLAFTSIYRLAPSHPTSLKEVWIGSTLAVAGWVSISLGFSYYVDQIAKGYTMYGSLTGIFLLLLWLYISSIILLLGAEVNALYFPEHKNL